MQELLQECQNQLQEKQMPIEVSNEELFVVPQSDSDFDSLKNILIQNFNVPDTEETQEILATVILHADNSISRYPLKYYSSRVEKFIGNTVAFKRLQNIKEKRTAQQAETSKQEVSNVSDNKDSQGQSASS